MAIIPKTTDIAKAFLKKKRKEKLDEAKAEINNTYQDETISIQNELPTVQQTESTPISKSKHGTSYISPITGDYISEEDYEKEKKKIFSGEALTKQTYERAAEAQNLSQQVGQFEQQPLQEQPLQDFDQAVRQGIIGGIPRALSFAVTGAGIGAGVGAAAGGVGALPGAAVGAASGFASGLASTMISQFKSQRIDTVNAQKRVLDEGKQTMKDWATMAEVDPANKSYYLAQYNQVAAKINQAYRQMQYDTARDVGKFEKALPDLAEFEAFYATGGERDTLDIEMRTALTASVGADYKILELNNRRGNK